MATRPVFRGAIGLNNIIEPHRLSYREDGRCPLVSASNIYIDNSGSVSRRKPKRKVFDGETHSFWTKDGFSFFVSEGVLYRLMPDESTVIVSTVVGDERLSYSLMMGRVYICNSTFRASVDENNVYPWVESAPLKDASDSRILGFPVSFSRCFVHAGRMCLVDGNLLWVGEPYAPGCFDMGAGPLVFNSEIGGCVSVKTGMFISDKYATFFIGGGGRRDLSLMNEVCTSPIIDGTAVVSSPAELAIPEWDISAAVWVCQDGVYAGAADGSVLNMTEGTLRFPKILSGSACIHDGYYIFSLEVVE